MAFCAAVVMRDLTTRTRGPSCGSGAVYMIVLTSRPAMIAFFRFAIYAPFNGDGNASGCSPEAFSMLLNHQFSMTNSGIAVDGIQKSCIMSGPPPASLWDAIKYACASTEGENDHPRASEIIRAFSPSTVCGLSMPPMKNPHGSPAGSLRRNAATLRGSNGL